MCALICFCRSHATAISQATGCKGSYSLMKLSTHNPIKQTVPDVMHTIKVVIEHVFKLLIGKEDSANVRKAEKELGRNFACATIPGGQKKKRGQLTDVTFRLSSEQLKVANERCQSIVTPLHVDFIPGAIFSKCSDLKSHDWKQVKA